ncbi:MAG: aminopeptidase [Deltaproteobacteria bacterium]|nr:aminopeptidase [Deltaproteobacteria bacterium]
MIARGLLLCVAAASLNGCFAAHYLAQATRGQIEILERRRPIDDVIADGRTPAFAKAQLAEVAKVKRFAEAHGLSATKSYTRYADLKRDAAVWVVSASERLAFRSATWWFPIVGRVPYLGWFRFTDAARFAVELQEQGLDVGLRPASAYSTLGWFEDPILSTMLGKDDGALFDLVNTILHESLHATFYVPMRTDLSESVASFVGDELTRDYLDERYGKASAERARYDADMRRSIERRQWMLDSKAALAKIYASLEDDAEKRRQKGIVLGELRRKLGTKRVINNATLAELQNYASGQDELTQLLKCFGRDWPRFIAALREWAKATPTFGSLKDQCP